MQDWYLPAHFANDSYTHTHALDTETSGLYEDGDDDSPPARVSTVSVAWQIDSENRAMYDQFSNVTVRKEQVMPGLFYWIASVAWPFDQGTEGKPESHGQTSLFGEPNLDGRQWRYLCEALPQMEQIYHNAKFDIHKMRVGTRHWDGVELIDNWVWDTQSGNSLLYPTLGTTSLKPVAQTLFGKEYADEAEVLKKYLKKARLPVGRYDLVPWDVIGPYADMDARLTMMLYLRQKVDIRQVGVIDRNNIMSASQLLERRFQVTNVLYRMEKKGIPYDEPGSREAALEGKKRAVKFAERLPFDEPTVESAKAFFFTEGRTKKGVPYLNHPAYSVTEKGSPQLTADITTRMVADNIPHARDWAEYRKIANAVSMWFEGYANKMGTDGRLRTCFRQNGTRSSRFSVERINLQAIPQNYRLEGYESLEGLPTPRQLIASAVPEGWDLWELDLAQAELRVGALYAKCERMLEMILRGVDLHTYTAKELFDIEQDHPKFGMYRQVGKRGNFSLIFGSGWFTFQQMLLKETGIFLPDNEADLTVRKWNRLYPEYKGAIDDTMAVVRKRQRKFGHGWVQFRNGERRYFQPEEDAHKAFNQRVQGNLAQFGIDWMLRSDEYLKGQGLDDTDIGGAGLILTIHDSQVMLLPAGVRGQIMAETCAGFANEIWTSMFPGVPGGSEPKKW